MLTRSAVFHLLRRARWALACGLALLALARAEAARASDLIIRYGRTPIGYATELEPHLVLGSDPPGPGYGSGAGVGVRASFVFAPEGFIRGVNDSAAIGVGLDLEHYYGSLALDGYRDQCLRFEPGPNGTSICTQVTSNGGTYNYAFVPVVLQWNFWFTDKLSAFGEPGVNLYFLGNHGFGAGPALYLGGRVRVADRITITARLGYPTVGVGASFMF